MLADPFTLLGLTPAFDLDAGELQRRFLDRVARLHPDVAVKKPEGEEYSGDSEVEAARLNDARAVLADPEKRASALLTLLGGPGGDREKSLPPGFLMKIMEVREQIEEVARSRDPAQVETWHRWARQRRAEFIATVAVLFREVVESSGSERPALRLVEIRRQLNAWRYIERLREQLEG